MGARYAAEVASSAGARHYGIDRGSMVHTRNVAESALLRFHDSQRSRPVPWIFLVLLHQRACTAVPESALSPRLQYCATPLVLALASGVVVSLECVRPGSVSPKLQTVGSRRQDPAHGRLLDR